ncbi:MAG TPA: ABC transporter substrate-binding protein [Burkholderiales bacterium]|jgi:branched-chain amino acid transport system substrate-binding protein|nr:ABC transporter substrate-binding protein [Burkholderiales bacterium]
MKKILLVGLGLMAGVAASTAVAEKKYDPGASDTEIKIGNTNPYSGPASAYGTIARSEAAYFKSINDQGGINGRKINFITLDDAYSPPKTVEQVRRLVEQEEVLFIFQSLGTPSNTAIHKYMNARKVPQLFVATGATKWGDPQNFPWTMGWQPNYQTEAHLYAKYLLENKPGARIAVLYQNDDYGKDYVKGFHDGLGNQPGRLIAKEVSYEVTDPTVDSQIVTLQASGADTLFIIATPKFAAQAIRKVYDVGWRPMTFLNNVSSSVAAVLQPAGLEKSVGLITALYVKDPTDPQWDNDSPMKNWLAWMKKYYPEGDIKDGLNVYGYAVAQTLVQVLKQCGDDLTRENVMRQAANLKNFEVPVLLPGIRINTSATDFYPIEQVQLARFDGKRWVLFGGVLGK